MGLLEKIDIDLKAAMKSGNTTVSGTLKMLKADITYEKAKTGEDLSDEVILEVINRAAKRRRESIKEFEKGNRPDLAKTEQEELVVIEAYLPDQLTEEDVIKIIDSKIAAMGDVSKKDFGRIMGEIMKELKGQVDGSIVKKVLSSRLEA